MRAVEQAGEPRISFSSTGLSWLLMLLAAVVVTFIATPVSAQLSALPPPSATSIGGHHLPLPPPSVSSIKPYGYGGNFGHPHGNGGGYGRHAGGYGYVSPYYYVPFDAYGYDYVGGGYAGGGPDLYSGPPVDPRDPTLHIVVEQPPAGSYREAPDDPQRSAAPVQSTPHDDASAGRDVNPGEPTVLVYRDGHKQEVSNYAIMGQTIYVFDKRTQKIAMSDVDVAATVKANEAQGIEFSIPAGAQTRAKDATVPQESAPDTSKPNPNTLTSALR
jgi:hypothetical protein